MIIYEGPSILPGDGITPIIAVVTGLDRPSANIKTGRMLQTWILVKDVHPKEAVVTGDDEAICGSCIHRLRDGHRTCYVNLGHAPTAVWNAYQRNKYESVDPEEAGELCAHRKIRIGSYGDPAAVPSSVWRSLIAHAKGSTGYTHMWRDCADLSDICMASCDSEEDVLDARALGYRTYRVLSENQELRPDEMACPASEEMGKVTTCDSWGLCAGSMSLNVVQSIGIVAHGSRKKYYNPVIDRKRKESYVH